MEGDRGILQTNPPAYNMDKGYKCGTRLAASPAGQGAHGGLVLSLEGPAGCEVPSGYGTHRLANEALA